MYTDRVVFFIDILGFRTKVEEASKDDKLMEKLINCLEKIESNSITNDGPKSFFYNLLKGDSLPKSDFQVLTFSDSLVASVSCDQPEAAMVLCLEIQSLQYELMKAGLLVRGAGHVGKLIHRSNGIMFGPAFNNVYHLETNIAKNPRIIISQELIDYIIKLGDSNVGSLLKNKVFMIYDDGPFAIDTFKWVSNVMSSNYTDFPLRYLTKHISEINSEIENNRYNPNVYMKLKWYKNMLKVQIESNENYEKCKDEISKILL